MQKDEFTPKQVDALKGRMPVDKDSPVSSLLLSQGHNRCNGLTVPDQRMQALQYMPSVLGDCPNAASGLSAIMMMHRYCSS